MRIFRKTAIREASFLQTLSACALKESALSIFRPKSETQSTFAKAFRLVPKITNASCWILGANLFPVTVRTLVLDSLVRVPLRNLRPSVIYSVPFDRIVQRAHLKAIENTKMAKFEAPGIKE